MSGSSPNSAVMSIGSSTRVTILAGSGRFGGKTARQAEREPEADRQDLHARPLETQSPGDRIATGKEQLGLLPADRHHRHDRHAGLDGGPHVAGAAAEVDDVLGERRPIGVVVAAGEHQHNRAVSQRLRGVLAARLDDAGAAQPITDIGDEDAVVGQCVERPVEAELLIERGGEDQHVGSEHAAGMVRHDERATGRRHRLQVAHFGAEVPLDDRAHPVRDLPGEPGIPLGDLWLVRPVAHSCVFPLPPIRPNLSMVLSKKENVISAGRRSMTDTVLVTGGFGLVGFGDGTAVGGRRPPRRHSRPRNTRQRQEGKGAARRRRGSVGRPDGSRPGATPRFRRRTRRDHSPRRDHRARDLPQRQSSRDGSTWTRTATLVRVAEAQPTPPRFVHASSNAVFGPRNPHRTPEPLTADDPMRPCDIYSGTKAEAEEIVRSSKSGMGGAAVRRRAQHRFVGDAAERRRHALRERTAQRQSGAYRRRPRRRVGMCRCDDGRRRRRDPADRGRRLTPTLLRRRSRRPSCRRWACRVRSRRDGRATPTATPTGSSPTGWTPRGRRKR